MHKKKVLIAAGGTGGHMFPAQALAQDLVKEGYDVYFAGAKLDSNQYFQRDLFSYTTIASATLKKTNPISYFKTFANLLKGLYQSWRVIQKSQPDLIVGFGSFHTAPILMAATLKAKKYVLFESNVLPGRVNRFFSRFASVSAVQFSSSSIYMHGNTYPVTVPFWQNDLPKEISKKEALAYFGLSVTGKTLLVFGGSQGARSLNESVIDGIAIAKSQGMKLQVIHFTGRSIDPSEVSERYRSIGVKACVKSFEENMSYAWSAADFAMCRAGAVTIAELIRFGVPAILVPFPGASEDHQYINALELQKLGFAICLEEKYITPSAIYACFKDILTVEDLTSRQEAISLFKDSRPSASLSDLINKIMTS
ncbi:MAG: UDP-N-acetylglucosamine--N-acetylmuramyl-(pentapeptide) pyrophosphoryl-undecaprenol N-acetylglucosamine transferase [Chlamydiae bacterium]|nr:UDP-N-acetylglucosamine--N-acetylmuramyl-(pentapeptide) pyrophosphoryl-undecaprenol N-acetylglucosamine transferase [Chlamydiota bacterium]